MMDKITTGDMIVIALVLAFIVAYLADKYNWKIKEWF